MTTLLQDLLYSARMLARSPGFAAVAIATPSASAGECRAGGHLPAGAARQPGRPREGAAGRVTDRWRQPGRW